MTMAGLKIQRQFISLKHPQLMCDLGGDYKVAGYVGDYNCGMKVIRLRHLDETYAARFPNPRNLCGGGDPTLNPECLVSVPGRKHPGEVMIDDFFYTTKINMM